MAYPRTDEDWENLAECIVTKMPSASPEIVGKYTVEATQTIFTWYKGEERTKALRERQFARDELMNLASQAGCVLDVYYWEVTNMTIGEVAKGGTKHGDQWEAVHDAKRTLVADFRHWEGHDLVIKVFDKSPDERAGITWTPVYTESYGLGGPSQAREEAEEVLGRISQPLDVSQRPFPQTYGDWVDLAEKIKDKAPLRTWSTINSFLHTISEEGLGTEEAKRWLVDKAGELGIP